MEFIINHAILHVLNRNEIHYSNEELDIDSDACCAFISKHLKKTMTDAQGKEAVFNDGSDILGHVNNYLDSTINFRQFSVAVCEKLSQIIKDDENISPADMIIVQYDLKGQGHLALIKINYRECFTHKIGKRDEITDNQIINVQSLDSGRLEAACIIPYSPMLLRVYEKPCDTPNYFSEQFLDCGAEMSKKEAVDIINEVVAEVNAKHFSDSVGIEARTKIAIMEEAIEDDGIISMTSVAAKAFPDNEAAREEFVSLARDAGLIQDFCLGEKYAKQQFAHTKFKAENGIEIKFPSELADDTNVIEFTDNDDGSVSVTLKKLRRVY